MSGSRHPSHCRQQIPPTSLARAITLCLALTIVLLPKPVTAATYTFTATTSNNWNDATNWNPSAVPNAIAAFAIIGDHNVNLGGNTDTIGGFTCGGGNGSSLSNGTLNLNNGGSTAQITATATALGTANFISTNLSLSDPTTMTTDSSSTVLVIASGASIDNRGNLLTFYGYGNTEMGANITGAGGLTTRAAQANLSGTNTYTGTTTVQAGKLTLHGGNAIADSGAVVVNSGGTLQIGDSETIGSLSGDAGSIVQTGGYAGSTLTTGGNNSSTTFAGTIQDNRWPFGLTKTGSGTMTLSGTNTYTGTTTVSGGTLNLTGGNAIADSGSVVVNGGGTLQITDGETIGSLSGGAGSTLETGGVNAVTLTTGGNGSSTTFAGTIRDNGKAFSLNKTGTGTLTLAGTNTYTGTTTVSEGMLVATDNLGSGDITVNSGGTLALNPGDYKEAITLNGSGVGGTSGALDILSGVGFCHVEGPITLGSDSTIKADSVNFYMSGDISNGGHGLTITGSGSPNIGGNISGSGGLSTSANNTQLSGTNTYTGTTTVQSGMLYLGGGSAIADSGVVAVKNGGTLGIGNSETIGSLSGEAGSILEPAGSSNVTLTTGGNHSSTTFAGTIQDRYGYSMSLTKSGSGTMTLSGTNTYTGTTTVNGGSLSISNPDNLGNTAEVTLDGGTLLTTGSLMLGKPIVSGSAGGTFDNGGNSDTLSGDISGNGAMTFAGKGSTTLTGINTFTGGTTISGGTLVLQGPASLRNGSVTVNSGATLMLLPQVYDNDITLNGSGVGGNSGALQMINNGFAPILNGSITLGSDSTIKMSNDWDLEGPLNNGGHLLTINATRATTLNGNIKGSGGMILNGTLTYLNGNNTYTGPTTLQSGNLYLKGGNAIADSGALNLKSGTNTFIENSETIGSLAGDAGSILEGFPTNNVTLTIGGNHLSTTYAGTIQDGFSSIHLGLTKTGSGTLTLSGTNTYTGPTTVGTSTVNGGTLAAGSAGAFSKDSVTTINPGSTLDLGGYAQTINKLVLKNANLSNGSLSGTIFSTGCTITNITGSSNLILTGANTFSNLLGTNAFASITNGNFLTNLGVGSDDLSNTGNFTNSGTWTGNIASNSGYIINSAGHTWNGDVLSGANVAGGQILNRGTWKGTKSYNNGGNLYNSGTWTGAIINTAGTFSNTGSLNGNLTNAAGSLAYLGNSGVINGDVSNSGKIAAISVMQVNGNYTQTPTGTLLVGVTPNTTSGPGVGYDQLNVTGNASLAGALDVSVGYGFGSYTLGSKYDLVHAGSLTGQFNTVSYNPGFVSYINPQLTYSGTDAYLTLNPTQAAFNSGQAANLSTWGTQFALLGMQQGLLNVQGDTTEGILRVNHQPDPGAWARYISGGGSTEGASLYNQSKLIGYGSEVCPGVVLGAAFTRTEDITKNDSQRVHTRATGLAVYGLINHGAWFVDSAISSGHLKTDSNRTLQSIGLTGSGNARGNYLGLMAKAGYRIQCDHWNLTPYALLGYQYTHRNPYSETGAGLLNMSYAAQTSKLSVCSLGTRIGTDLKLNHTLTLSPWVDLGASAYGGDRKLNQTTTLGSVSQQLQANGAPSLAGVINAGVALMSSANWSAQLAYRGQFSGHSHMNTADVKIVYRW